MKELEHTKCEVRKAIELQLSIWDKLNSSVEDDGIPPAGSPGYNANSAPLGNFFEDATYAWLSYGARLAILNVKTSISISSWTFRDKVTSVSPFPSQPGQVPLLLVGLDNGASKIRDSSGLVCVFDCTTSQVLRAIRMPAGVEQLCVVAGGAEWEDFGENGVDNFIGVNGGLACVALRNLDHLVIDLKRTSWEGPDANPLCSDESNPAELDFSERSETSTTRHKYSREKHKAFNWMNSRLEQYIGFNRDEFESSSLYQEFLTSSLICSRKIGCLVSGCLGRIIIWQMDGSVRWVSPPLEESASVSHLALLEPTDDPRPFCYLWSVYQEETSRVPPVLRMYAMLFERKYSDKGSNAYFNLESDPSLKFELELDEGSSVKSLCPIIRESSPDQSEFVCKRGEESLLLINLNCRVLLFDLNQWYKEQMPHTVGECQNPNAFLASYITRSDDDLSSEDSIINVSYLPSSLKEFPTNGPSPPEELFFPNSLSLEWINLCTGKLTFWFTRGLQTDLLRETSSAGPVILIDPSETFYRCSTAGLIVGNSEGSSASDKDHQRELLLTLFLEQRCSQFLLQCASDWSDGSASYLFHSFLRWAMQRACAIKLTVDRMCIPLYDESGSSVGESEIKTLRFFAQQLECISSVVTNLSVDTVDLTSQRRALIRVSTYLQVLLWFYDVGLLPETHDELDNEASLPMGFSLKIPYPFKRLATMYQEKRGKSDGAQNFFIDELVTRECNSLKSEWEKEGAELSLGGNYPPASLQLLLRSFLTDIYSPDTNEMENKHQITMYLLMDLKMLLSSCPGAVDRLNDPVNQLIEYPSAFKLSPSLIKLTQALWRLDHEDYQGFLDMITDQLISDTDVKEWHHKLVMRTLVRNNQNKQALIYLRVRKPPLSSLDDQATVISLSVEHGLLQSAFHRRPPSHYAQLLTRFFQSCKIYGKLNDILHLALDSEEEEAFVKFLENDKSQETRLLYYLQRCRYAEAGSVYPTMPNARGITQKLKQPASLSIFGAYRATLPEITRKFSSLTKRTVEIESRRPRPMSHYNNRGNNREMHEMVIRKAKETFLRGERTQTPFISAPCASLRTGAANVDTNCVLFVERAKKPYGKRRHDDRQDDDDVDEEIVGYNNGEERKRRKIAHIETEESAREVGMSMAFDTPLVKRKNQMINARDTPVETPHSILKIRQMVRESSSSGADREASEEAPEEKERKPRQIRFSIGGPPAEQSLDEVAMDNCEEEGELATRDSEDGSEETERSIDGGSLEENEDYFSPDISEKSLSETTILSETSFISENITSGPRPRPSLRRTNLSSNDSSNDLLRRSLLRASDASRKTTWTPAREEKTQIAQTPKASFLSSSVYSVSILSPDTSFEDTPGVKCERVSAGNREQNINEFVEESAENCRDCGGIGDSFDSVTREINRKSVGKSGMRKGFCGDGDEDANSEVLMEVDGFGLDRDSETRSRAESNVETSVCRESFPTVTIPEESRTGSLEMDKEDEISEERRDDWSKTETTPSKESGNEGIVENIEETDRPSEDYDDELMALKYEEEEEEDDENDESFQSLSNSVEISQPKEKSIGEISEAANSCKKNEIEELNITDDESSRSVEASLSSESANHAILEKTISVEKIIGGLEAPNITDDESNSTYDSSIFSSNVRKEEGVKTFPKLENERVNNEDDSSLGSSIFSSGLSKNENFGGSSGISNTESEEINRNSSGIAEMVVSNAKIGNNESETETRVTEGRQSTRRSKMGFVTPRKSKASPEELETENLTPRRSTRSRRASSVAQEAPSSPLPESPLVKSNVDKPGRLRRASSLATDAFPSSGEKISRTLFAAAESPAKRGGFRRSVSLAKEIFIGKALEESVIKEEELPVRRSSRKAASMQRDSPEAPKTPVKGTRAMSKTSLVEENVDEEPAPAKTRTRNRRAASVTKDETKRATRGASAGKEIAEESVNAVQGKRLTRASSLAKEIGQESHEDLATRQTRKRGSSVPKETEIGRNTSLRLRRGASKDSLIEDINETATKPKKGRGVAARTGKAASPASSTRSRLSSISSIPEEEEQEDEDEVFSGVFQGKKTQNKRTTSARERRAVSADLPTVEIKRKTRAGSAKSAITEEAIKEEPSEEEVTAEPKVKAKRKPPVRRKRTASTTSATEDDVDVTVEKFPLRRPRKLSQRSNESNDGFQFSPPDKAQDRPDDDQKEMRDVPDYVFSPPHTRSKHITTNAPRREIRDFISVTEKQKQAARRVRRPQVQPLFKTTNPLDLWGTNAKFVVRKRSKSTLD